jgi:hypothetical protein
MYNPALAPNDHLLFLYIKKLLAGQRLRFDQDTKHILQDWLKGLAANCFEEGIQKLVTRYDKCLNFHGDCV